MPPIRRHYHWLFTIHSAVADPASIIASLSSVAQHGLIYHLVDKSIKGYCYFRHQRYIPNKRPWWSYRTTWLASTSDQYIHYFKDLAVVPISFGESTEDVFVYNPDLGPKPDINAAVSAFINTERSEGMTSKVKLTRVSCDPIDRVMIAIKKAGYPVDTIMAAGVQFLKHCNSDTIDDYVQSLPSHQRLVFFADVEIFNKYYKP